MESFLLIVFIIGYILIAFESTVKINKAAFALLTGIICWWIIVVYSQGSISITSKIAEKMGDISAILFFLIGAMTIVELIDLHNGFDLIVKIIRPKSNIQLLWIIAIITFFLSPLLDNLTTTIVMISVLQKIISSGRDRLYISSVVILAANAGGAWSPIGDVTTSMLWIGGQLTAGSMIKTLFLPSIVSLVVPVLIISLMVKKQTVILKQFIVKENDAWEGLVIFWTGISLLLMVPLFKWILHLPPFMCMLISLALLWLISELMHKNKSSERKSHLSVDHAIQRIDMSSIIFFLGILLSIGALEYAGLLHKFSAGLSDLGFNDKGVTLAMGFASAIIDNVPLIAGAMGMYPLSQFPVNHEFWSMIAFAGGTGGSMLIIGSAAGVVAMGMEKISFLWYLKNIGWIAVLGFLSGMLFLMVT